MKTSDVKMWGRTALVLLAVSATGFLGALPFRASATASEAGNASERIEMAFHQAHFLASQPAPAGVDCADQTWPDIDPNCLILSDGATAGPARVIAIAD